MKIKRILFITFCLATSAQSLGWFHPPQTQALTNAEKESCYERWAGRSVGQAGGSDAKSFDENAFKNTACAKQNTCKIERYEDGAVIHCYNVSTKKFDSQNVSNRPSADPSTAQTTTARLTKKNCDDISTNVLPCSNSGGNPVIGLLIQIVNFMAVGVGIAVVGGIIWGAMHYATSNGDTNKIKQGKTIIVNSIIGLVLFIFMYTIVNFLVPGGILP